MKKQVGQLVQLDMFEDGLNLQEFKEVYDQEFGYPLEYQCYGFYSLEDFVFLKVLSRLSWMDLAGR